MSGYGILIDYNWCTGCHSCEMACQMEKKLPMGLRQESCTCPSPFYCACCAANGGTGYPSLLLCSARVS